MNKMHVLGIMCSLQESTCPVSQFHQPVSKIIPELSIIHLYPKPISNLSLRELIDQLECMQLNWGPVIGESVQGSLILVKACMARLGQIAHNAYPADGFVLADPQHTTPLPASHVATSLSIISRKALRQVVCTCFSLLRVQDIISRSKEVPEPSEVEIGRVVKAMKVHHVESSMDFFNVLQQMVYLAPGMRLAYRTNFAGMYNDVSQVVYFHYPRFCRQPQLPLKSIPDSPNHMLPLISQLIPDIPIVYEDDSRVPGLTIGCMEVDEEQVKWAWLICCSEVFLIHSEKSLVLTSRQHSLASLVVYFLNENERRVGEEEDEVEENNKELKGAAGEPFTAHGHLRLI
jgi:hypothetical protein